MCVCDMAAGLGWLCHGVLRTQASAALVFVTSLFVTTHVLVAPTAHAYDVQVDADTAFQSYEVRSPGLAAFTARRRLLQTLSLSYADSLGRSPTRPSPRVLVTLRMRLDQDFGETCLVARGLCFRASDTASGSYQPLASDTSLDAMLAYAELAGLPASTRVRLGRQLVLDDVGFLRVDGAMLHAEPLSWLGAEVYGGGVVRSGSFAGAPAFELTGVPRENLTMPGLAGYVAEPLQAWAAGAYLALGAERLVRARVGFRHVSDATGALQRRLSAGLVSMPIKAMRLDASAVLDLLDRTFIDAHAGLSLRAGLVRIGLTADHHVPRFDPSSIWAFFQVAPITELRVATSLARTRELDADEIGVALRSRTVSLRPPADEHDLGLEAFAGTTVVGVHLAASATAWRSTVGPQASVAFDARRALLGWLALELHASVWHFEDTLRSDYYGTSLSEAVGARFTLSPRAVLLFEVQHAHSRVVGHRFRGLATFSFEVWR